MNTVDKMPFLNADNHILHLDTMGALEEETTYWPAETGDHQNPNEPTLLDPYIDPMTVMTASEALMRMSEHDFHIEPSSLNVHDSSNARHFSPANGNHTADFSLRGVPPGGIATTRPPRRDPFTALNIAQWTEQFHVANRLAQRWAHPPAAAAGSSTTFGTHAPNTRTTTRTAGSISETTLDRTSPSQAAQ